MRRVRRGERVDHYETVRRWQEAEPGFREEEAPVTRIKINTPFYIGRYEVTRGEFRAFVEATGHKTGKGCMGGDRWYDDRDWQNPGFPQDNNHPVVCVTWDDARAYVA